MVAPAAFTDGSAALDDDLSERMIE